MSEVVKRPSVRERVPTGFTKKLRETASTGRALRLTTAREAYSVPGSFTTLRHHGLRVRRKIDGDDLLVWCEPLPEKKK